MADVKAQLREAYEAEGYDVSDVTDNRGQIRVILAEEAGGESVRSILTDVVGEDGALGVNVTNEAIDGHNGISTVVSFRHRT